MSRILAAVLLLAAQIVVGQVAAAGDADSRGLSVVPNENAEAAIQPYAQSHALLIGVSDYTAGWPDLNNIPAELDTVGEMLGRNGFSVSRIDNPTSDELESVLKEFIEANGFIADNRLLVYFAGHGYTRQEGSKGYLVPADAPDPTKDELGFLRKSLRMTTVMAMAREIESRHVLFLFDSCFSGTIFKSRALPEAPPHINRLTSQPVRQFITAGDAGETVPARSVFTPAFVDAIEHGLGDLNGDGFVTGTELGLFLQDRVAQAVPQTPQYGKINDYELSRGDFVFTSTTRRANVANMTPRAVEQAVTSVRQMEKREPFRDELARGGEGPEMIVVPGGSFMMGDSRQVQKAALPVHSVQVAAFAMSTHEITNEEFALFSGERVDPAKAKIPAIVDFDQARAYATWLSGQTGQVYRLATEAEWEYAARSGTQSPYHYGQNISIELANFDDGRSRSLGAPRPKRVDVGSFAPNGFNLFDMHGNVAEWVSDCWNDSYADAPTDGTAWQEGDCNKRVRRGGSAKSTLAEVSASFRDWDLTAGFDRSTGIRIVREL